MDKWESLVVGDGGNGFNGERAPVVVASAAAGIDGSDGLTDVERALKIRITALGVWDAGGRGGAGRGLHSFPFQLNLRTSVHSVTQLDS
jgi:hypothetical protein